MISITILLLTLPCIVSGEGFSSLNNAREITDKAMGYFKLDKISEGYSVLKPYWPLPSVEIDNLINKTTTQWPMVKQRFGESLGTEFIKEERVGKSFVRYTYLHKFNNHAIRWLFILYKPKGQWVINGVSFDDNVNELFRDNGL
jgi:hypothetical protein